MSPQRTPVAVSSCLVLLSAFGLLLVIQAQAGFFTGALSYPLREHPQLWMFCFVGGLALGIWLLWNRSHSVTDWKPEYDGRRFGSAVLYTRDGCPLCDEAAEVLARYRQWLPPTTEVDIDLDPDLKMRLGAEIPVIQFDGQTRFKGHVNEVLLRRLIDGTPPVA
ncbi:glutaredoxin family protein [Thalassoglobus sp. JC818]|uniref:glutaredoxin family protein n=1 Tax=Thalassoglobus sp. JC818 TaxID=3232136 RepID=UPI003458B6BE